ncbi:hypothetical protein [Arthrobacter sp. CG_A4]|uniref:hypothetical protein n=1 Tax=Arthrobacter sp. CG_A4 TaxID=3071706 RepID=UPI002DF905BA|nr:hypothetical protein [Arthrobacter sp. CG_A4]
MNEQANGQLQTPSQSQGNRQGSSGGSTPAGYGEPPRFTVDKANGRTAGKKNEAVLGPFTIRDLTVFGSTLILFIASLIPMFAVRYNLWNLGSLFFLGLGVLLPLIVAALFVARRVSPGTNVRIGSLSVDQFASVVASFTVAFFFLAIAGAFVPSMLLALVGALGLFAATVLGRLIPYFAGDFLGREEAPAHIVARETAEPVRKPRAPKAPKDTSEPKAPKSAGIGQLSGWAKRLTSGGQGTAPGADTRGNGSHSAAPGGGSYAGPEAAPAGPAPAAPGPVVGSTATQNAGIVPAAAAAAVPAAPAEGQTQAAAAAPAAEEQTRAAGVVTTPPAAPAPEAASTPDTTAGRPAPDARLRAAAAAEETRAAEVPAAAGNSAPTTVNPQVRSQEPIGATVDPASRPEEHQIQPVHEAFWFAVAQPRTAFDEHTGAPAFVIEPGGWVLALEDRGHEFLVQHTDGRAGLLRDLSNIERG